MLILLSFIVIGIIKSLFNMMFVFECYVFFILYCVFYKYEYWSEFYYGWKMKGMMVFFVIIWWDVKELNGFKVEFIGDIN